MPITPLLEGLGRITVNYSRAGHPLTTRFFVNAGVSAGEWAVKDQTFSVYLPLPTFWATLVATMFYELFFTDTTFVSLELATYEDGAWIIRDTSPLTATGSGELDPIPCAQLIMTFRDGDQHFSKLVLMEPSMDVPIASMKHGESWSDLTTFMEAVVTQVGDGSVFGDYICSHRGTPIETVTGWSQKINDRCRRERGYV